MLLFFLSTMIFTTSAYPMYYRKVCENLYPRTKNESADDYICNDFQGIQSNNDIQKSSTDWMMYGEFAKFLPNVLGTMFLGSYGDRYGRKIPMLAAIASMLIYLYLYMVFVSLDYIPLYAITVMAAVTSLGGQLAVFLSSQFSEVADYITDENKLTVRYAVLTSFWSGAIVVGGNIAPFILTYIGYEWNTFIGLVFMVLAFFSVLILFPSKPSASATEKRSLIIQIPDVESRSAESSSTSASAESKKSDAFGWLKEGLSLYKSAWRTLNKIRPNHGRIHLLIYCVVGILYACEDGGLDSITVLYIYHDPLAWSPQLYTWWSAAMSMCQLLGSVIGAVVFKKCGVSDTMILIISIISGMAKMVGIGIGQKTWVMFASLTVGCLSTVGFSALRSLVVQLGDSSESGELLSLINLSIGWCTIFSALVFNNLYVATLTFYTGFPWLFEAFLLFLCVLAILVIHIQTRKRPTPIVFIENNIREIERF